MMFAALYHWTMALSAHQRAPYYLAALSVAESSFFPIPPDVMLAPMALARPNRAWFLAGLTTVASIVGGLLGYLIGYLAFTSWVAPILQHGHYQAQYAQTVAWFDQWGIAIVVLAGFSPIPYKLFTIASGALQIAVLPFILASLIGRGARFYLVALLVRWGGERFERYLRRHIDSLGWAMILVVLLLYWGYVLFGR